MTMKLQTDALEAAFVAFGYAGSDEENAALVLKLMAAIEAYLQHTACEGEEGVDDWSKWLGDFAKTEGQK